LPVASTRGSHGASTTPHFACDRHELLQGIEADIDVLAVSVLDSADLFFGSRTRLIQNLNGFAQAPDFDDTSHGSLLGGFPPTDIICAQLHHSTQLVPCPDADQAPQRGESNSPAAEYAAAPQFRRHSTGRGPHKQSYPNERFQADTSLAWKPEGASEILAMANILQQASSCRHPSRLSTAAGGNRGRSGTLRPQEGELRGALQGTGAKIGLHGTQSSRELFLGYQLQAGKGLAPVRSDVGNGDFPYSRSKISTTNFRAPRWRA
jgi:hypothetical protein